MMHGNSKYPLELKFAVCCGEELTHFSKSDIRKIPRATLSEWRKTPISKFVNQFENGAEHPTVIKYLSRRNDELKRSKQAIDSYMTFVSFIKDAMGVKPFTRMLSENKERFVEVVEGLEGLVTQQYFLEHAGISRNRYWGWKNILEMNCSLTADKICARRTPNKIRDAERQLCRQLVMAGGENKNVIYSHAIRKGQIAMGRGSFYNIVQDLTTTKQMKTYKPRAIKIRAKNVHDIWHADVSIIKTVYGEKWYLYCIVDNKSRGIVNWRLTNTLRKSISADVLREAFLKHNADKLIYMTDGGSENKKIMETDLLYMYFKVTHWIAGKSVMASNSMIERVFHTLKNEFGSVHIAKDGLQLEQILSSTIEAYMNRPHSAHGIYTPLEVLEGRDNWLDVKKVIADAKKERVAANKVARCENCSCSVEERCSEDVGVMEQSY